MILIILRTNVVLGVASVFISIPKITSTPNLARFDILSLLKKKKVDLTIEWTGGHLEFNHSHHSMAESKVSPQSKLHP